MRVSDDRPVGGGMGSKAFAAAPEASEDFSQLSIDQMLTHANWKARKEGYDKIAKDPKKYRTTFFDKMAKISVESNAAAQEALLDALGALVPICDSDELGLICQAPLSLVIEKGITGRPKAVSSGQNVVSLLVENGKQKEVCDSLLPGFTHKTPKNRMAAAQLCTILVGDFGVQHFPLKDILKAMQPLFNDANPQVRKEAAALCCQCYKYIGSAIKGFLTDLRDVQLQELEKQFESVTLGGTPPKKIKGLTGGDANGKGGSAMKPPTAIVSLLGTGASGDADDAAFELLDQSPVIPKLPKKFFPTALDRNTPWLDRSEYVTSTLLPLLAAPRFRASDDYHELASMMKIYLVDPQAPLMLLGFQMIQECARGLRASFAGYAKTYIAPLFEKMKDKKTSVLQHITVTLEKLIRYHCITMDQCVDEMEQVSQSKNPSQRHAVISFCTRMVDLLNSSQYQRLGRSTNMLKRMVNDEKSENRDAAYVLLSKLTSVFGEGQLRAVYASMDEKQRTRMQIVIASADVGGSSAGSPLLTPKSTFVTPSTSPAKKFLRVEELAASRSGMAELSSATSAASRRVASAHGSRVTGGADGGGGGGGAPDRASGSARPSTVGVGRATAHGLLGRSGSAAAPAPSLDDPISLESTLPPRMEAGNLMLGLLNGDTAVLDLLRSHEWSQRFDGMLRVKNTTEQWSAAESTRYFGALTVYLRNYPGFKESTFQVFQAVLNVLSDTMSKATSIPPGAGYAIVAGGTPRLTEMKNRQPVRDICSRVGQRLGYRFVIQHMMLVAKEVRTPKLLQECNEYFTELVTRCTPVADSPPAGESLDVRGMLEYLRRPCFEQTTPTLRTASVQLLVALGRYDPTAVQAAVQSLPPQIVTQFEQQRQPGPATLPAQGRRESAENRSVDDGAGTGTRAPRPTLPRPRASVVEPAPPPVTAAEADGPQKRRRGSSQSPGPSSHPGRRSTGAAGASRRARSTSERLSAMGLPAVLPGEEAGAAAARRRSRTPPTQSLEEGTPRAAEMPSALRPVVREIASAADWRDRLDAVHRVEAYIDGNNGLLPPGAAAPLLRALGTRFEESNKNIVIDVLRAVQRVVVAGGAEESRQAMRRLVPGALAMLGDQKTVLREEARKVVFMGMDVCGLDMLLQALQRPLGSDSNIARQNTLEAMVYGFENLSRDAAPVSRAGLQLLVPSIVKGLMDRIHEVRIAAESVVGYLLPVIGDEPILRYVQQLRPADQQAVRPAIERQLALHTPAPASASDRAPDTTIDDGADEEETRTPAVGAARRRRANSMPPCSPRMSQSASPVTTPRRNGSATRGQLSPRRASAATGQAAPASGRYARRASTSMSMLVPSADPHTSSASATAVEASSLSVIKDIPTISSGSGSVVRNSVGSSRGTGAPRQSVERETPASVKRNEEMYSTQEILVGLRSATPSVAYSMCTDFMKHLRAGDDCGTPEMMQVMMERLYDGTQKLEPDLTLGLIGCLSAMFMTPRSAQRCRSSLLFRILGTVFDCLLSEQFSLHENVLKSLNSMTLKLLEGCPPNDVFSALISRMTSYSTAYLQSGRKSDLKYIQVTVKCVMRLDLEHVAAENVILCCHEYLLQHPPSSFRNLDDLPIRTVKTILQTTTRRYGSELLICADRLVGPQNLVTHFIRACLENRDRGVHSQRETNEKHAAEESIRQQRASLSPAPKAAPPPSSTPAAPAATPARATPTATATAKTKTTTTTTATTTTAASPKRSVHVDPTEGTVASPAPPAVAAMERRATVTAPAAPPTPTPKSSSTPAASASVAVTPTSSSGGAGGAGAEERSMASIFSRIRHHATSQQGIDELYAYLQAGHPNCSGDFDHQLLRCSEAFRVYIKRKLDRKIAEDPNVPKSFALPESLRKLA